MPSRPTPTIATTCSYRYTSRVRTIESEFWRGLALFNAEDYFAAHEVWESAWREAPAVDRRFFQSLIQAAVALYHHGRGNSEGARRLAQRGRGKIADYPAVYRGVDLLAFWTAVESALAGGPAPTLSLSHMGPHGFHHV
jgi:predicted metal-dependent hydrolase